MEQYKDYWHRPRYCVLAGASIMKLRTWFWGEDEPKVIEAKLPGQREPEGELQVHSPTWIYVQKWAENRLDDVRLSNDSLGKSEVQTAALRGEIACLKRLLALPLPSTKPPRSVLKQRGILEEEEEDVGYY